MGAFRMPKLIKVTGLSSSVAKSFASRITPCTNPTEAEAQEALRVNEAVRCAYGSDICTERNLLHPLAYNKTPTGLISEIHNLVLSCNKCNQLKGSRECREWITSNASPFPKMRDVLDLEERIARLEEHEGIFERTQIDFGKIVRDELRSKHWQNYGIMILATEEA